MLVLLSALALASDMPPAPTPTPMPAPAPTPAPEPAAAPPVAAAPASHCGDAAVVFTCTVKKSKLLSVCESADKKLTYAYGPAGAPELTLADGVAAERALASGYEYTWTFMNEGHSYAAFVVEARPEDTGAGVLIEKAGEHVATVSCVGDWFKR